MACDNGGFLSSPSVLKDDPFVPPHVDDLVITLKPMTGKTIEIALSQSDTIDTLKNKIESASGIAVAEQCLTFKGKQLNDGDISSNQIKNKAIILLRQVRPKIAAQAASTSSTSSLSSEPSTPPRTLCLASCGFYGDPLKDNLCSRCYDDREKKIREEAEEKKAAQRRQIAEEEAKLAAEREANRPKQLKLTRCFKCNARVGPAIIKCRCEYGFCASCRYPEQHDCTYDYKAHDAKILMDNNPLIRADKLKDRT